MGRPRRRHLGIAGHCRFYARRVSNRANRSFIRFGRLYVNSRFARASVVGTTVASSLRFALFLGECAVGARLVRERSSFRFAKYHWFLCKVGSVVRIDLRRAKPGLLPAAAKNRTSYADALRSYYRNNRTATKRMSTLVDIKRFQHAFRSKQRRTV